MASSEAAGGAGGGNQIPLMDLNIQDLNMLRQQTEQQLQALMQNFTQLRMASSKFGAASRAVKDLKKNPVDSEMLVPITEAMFVPATVKSNDNLLVEIGTGYFVEQSATDATAFLQRKIGFLNKRLEELEQIIRSQRKNGEQIKQVLQIKVQEQMKSQEQGAN